MNGVDARWARARLEQQVESLRELLDQLGPENRGLADRLSHRAAEAIGGLKDAIDELSVADAELREQNQKLIEAHSSIDRERRRYADLFGAAPDAYLVTDAYGKILEANQAAADLFNIPQRFLTGKILPLFFPAGEQRSIRKQLLLLGKARQIRGWETGLQARGGEIVEVSINGTAVHDPNGGFVAARWLLRDITGRKRAERAASRHLERLQLVHDIDRAILEARSPVEIAEVVVARLRRLTGCASAAVVLFDEERKQAERLAVDSRLSTARRAGQRFPLADYGVPDEHARGEVALIPDLESIAEPAPVLAELLREGMRSCLAVPLITRGRLVGGLSLASDWPDYFLDETVALARQVADSLAVALDNAQLLAQTKASRQQLQNLGRRLIEVQESERREIAKGLHDDAGQMLAALMLGLGNLEQVDGCSPVIHERVARLKEMADHISTGVHSLAIALRPASLDRLGLVAAVRQYLDAFQEQTGVEVSLVAPGLEPSEGGKPAPRLARQVETAMYRVVQEALANVARHSHAAHASVILERRHGRVLAIVEDDGDGFEYDEALARGRLGLVGMRERAEVVGGTLTIETAPGAGTTVFMEAPYDGEDPGR